MSKTIIEVDDVTMRFRMNSDRIMSLKEFVTTALRGKLRYQEFTALDHVSFQVKRGETLGLIGRNGAGKSTFMNILTGNLKAASGQILYDGEDIVKMGREFRGILGYMPQQQALYPGFTAEGFLAYIQGKYGL